MQTTTQKTLESEYDVRKQELRKNCTKILRKNETECHTRNEDLSQYNLVQNGNGLK